MAVLTAKSSTIFVATDEGTAVYRSIKEIPVPLRRKLQQSVEGMHSATILIADKRGREELIRALQGQPSSVQCRLAELHNNRQKRAQATAGPARKHIPVGSLRDWLELLLPLAIGASLWFFIQSRF